MATKDLVLLAIRKRSPTRAGSAVARSATPEATRVTVSPSRPYAMEAGKPEATAWSTAACRPTADAGTADADTADEATAATTHIPSAMTADFFMSTPEPVCSDDGRKSVACERSAPWCYLPKPPGASPTSIGRAGACWVHARR